jgi:hypothetical protein
MRKKAPCGQGFWKQNNIMKLIVIGLVALLAGSSAGICQTTSFDWFIGDKAAGTGKFIFGTFTRFSNGDIRGSGISYRHANREGTQGGRITLSGNDFSKRFRTTSYEGGVKQQYDGKLDLRVRTVRTYRATFTSEGKRYEMGAIQR